MAEKTDCLSNWWLKMGLAAGLLLVAGAAQSELTVGFQLERFEDPTRQRPVMIDWWYPTTANTAAPFNYGLGRGLVVEGGAILPGRHPLIVLSHGSLGAARNYAWIAESLAASGYLVAGVSHFGESYVYGAETIDPAAVLRVRERPLDVSAVLSFIEGSPLFPQPSVFSRALDRQRIGFLGHSSGGATGVFLSGALFDEELLGQYCASVVSKTDRGCDYSDGMPASDAQGHQQTSYADPRLKAIVALDPALGPGFYDYSSIDPNLRLLIVGSVDNDFLPFQQHAKQIASAMRQSPPGEYLQTHWLGGGEGHFVYLNECDLQLKAGSVALCKDRPSVSRQAVHDRLRTQILAFFEAHL